MPRPGESARLVYSTDGGRVAYTGNRKPESLPGAKPAATPRGPAGPSVPDDGTVRVHRQKAGRGGKTARALRTVVQTCAPPSRKRTLVEILE